MKLMTLTFHQNQPLPSVLIVLFPPRIYAPILAGSTGKDTSEILGGLFQAGRREACTGHCSVQHKVLYRLDTGRLQLSRWSFGNFADHCHYEHNPLKGNNQRKEPQYLHSGTRLIEASAVRPRRHSVNNHGTRSSITLVSSDSRGEDDDDKIEKEERRDRCIAQVFITHLS